MLRNENKQLTNRRSVGWLHSWVRVRASATLTQTPISVQMKHHAHDILCAYIYV